MRGSTYCIEYSTVYVAEVGGEVNTGIVTAWSSTAGCGVVVRFTCWYLCPTSVLDVNVSVLTNYVEFHSSTNPTIDLVYKMPWYLPPSPRRSSMYHLEHHAYS